jgi:predicted metalloprotease with PDZ domain
MKQARWIVVAVLAIALISPAIAGKGHKCEASTQDCLNKMAAKLKDKGWVGIEFDKNKSEQPVITKVVPDSPAEKAGLQKGDVLLAINGVKYGDDDKEKWHKVKKAWKPGSTITYTVARGGGKKAVDVTLGKVPEEVMYAWLGEHMMQHVTVDVASK